MTNIPVTASGTEAKPAVPANQQPSTATPQQQNQGAPAPANDKPNEQQK